MSLAENIFFPFVHWIISILFILQYSAEILPHLQSLPVFSPSSIQQILTVLDSRDTGSE